jgi:uncharacterized protein YfaS (alpha-2-macroglobulin family)
VEHLAGEELVRWKPIFIVLLLLVFLMPAGGQSSLAYFSISTNKTFLPGEKIGIRVYSSDVASLEFRVYKVNDPMAFLERLDDPHQFGHISPTEEVETPTLLERFHDWKHSVWVDIRNFFRRQFSSKSRAEIREKQSEALKSSIGSAAVFAQVPVLNSSQLVARWHQELPVHFYSETQTVPVKDLAKGVYLVEATDGALRAYTIVVVSELGIITKTAPGQALAFVADRRTGAPVAGADVRFWSDKNEQAHLKTDANGLVESPMSRGQYQDVRFIAVRGDDVALVTPESYNLSTNPEEDWKGYVYTDRPVYRPTHTVHFKVILRTRGGEQYKVPAGVQTQVTIEDPSSKTVLQASYPVSAYGTIHGDLELPASAALGYYSISAKGPDGKSFSATGGFRVEEYKKPEYEVKVTTASLRVLQGSPIEATIEAKYYFGEPVAGADVKYVVHTSTYWSPFIDHDDDNDLSGGDSGDGSDQVSQYDYGGDQESEQSGKLDADGRLKIHIPTRIDERRLDLRYRIEARVTDAGNREISGHNSALATYGSFQVGISAENYFAMKGEEIRTKVVARDYDGKPIQTPVRVELVRHTYDSSSSPTVKETVIESRNAETDADGNARVTFSAKQEGDFILRVKARTPENREVVGTDWVWVSTTDQSWYSGQSREIKLIADKKSYKVGDIAHILVMTGMPDSYLLITTEALTIQSKRVIHATSPTATVDIPVLSQHQPNVFVAVAFLHDNKFYESEKNLKVPAVQQKLQIEIQPSKKQYVPGEKANYTLLVHDSNGKPVSGEFSLGVVDEAIYGIYPDDTGDINNFFFGATYNRVSTDSSMAFYFSGEAGKKAMFLAYRGSANPRALAQLKPETLVQPKIRKLFPDTALWVPDIHTDANGRGEAQLSFPDSLTSWRATVRGVTLDTKVGNATNNVIVRKNLMVRLAVPRFLRQGDEVVISAIVHNYLTTTKTVQVSLDVKGLEVLSGSAAPIEVPSKGEAKLDWRVRANNVHYVDLIAKALTNEESDALEITLPVIPVGVKQTDAKSGSLVNKEQEEKTVVTLPGDPALAAPTLDININSSFAGSIFAALDYLTSYPYGCTEQTMSSFLPNIVVAKAMKDLNLTSKINSLELEKKIQAGLARLKDYQHDDGGWGWWKDDDSQVFMTAYVVSGLGQAHAAGYDAAPGSLSHAEEWLSNALAKYPNMRPDLRSYVVYALAINGVAKPEHIQAAWDNRSSMSTQGLAMLGLTLQMAGDKTKALEIAAALESKATVSDTEASWAAAYDYFMEFELDDAAETTAYAVRFLSLAKPDSPLLPKAAFWLVNHRNGGYFWDSTKQTAMVVFGLTEYVKASHELDANFRAEVYVNGKQVMTHQFTQADALNPVQPVIHLDASQLQQGANEIRIHKSGVGKLYWSASGSFYSSDKHLVQNNKFSLNITRDYFRMVPEQDGRKIVYRLDPLQGDLHVGDVVAVRLTVGGGEWRYLLMEDPIPAGAEFIQKDNLYELKTKPSWWSFWFSRREFHDDRAAIFQTYFKTHQEYVYLIKIVNPGKFRVSPAMVRPMYQTSFFATSDAIVLEVK